jgi:very-short-patch-repair endonuclease
MALAPITSFAAEAASQHGAIGRDQLRALSYSRHQVRRLCVVGVLVPLSRDVFVVAGTPDTWRRRLWAGLLEAGPEAFVSHRSTAALMELPGFRPTFVDITVTEKGNRRLTLSTHHTTSWVPAHHQTRIDGLPCSTLARCVFELAGLSSPTRLRRGLPYVHEGLVERTYDNATKRGLTLHAESEVVATLAKRGRKGTQLMRRILDERGEGFVATESELEDLLLAVIAANGLPLPEKQRVLGGETPAGRVDFFYAAVRLVIEADSRKHHTALLDRRNDQNRDLDLAAAGFGILRVTYWDLVHQPERFIAALKAKLAS